MFQASLPVFNISLNALSSILDQADAHAASKKVNSSVLLHSRLSPDMFALIRQVQIATEQAKNGSARPASVEAPPYEDNETTMDELKTRIARTVAYPRFQRWRMIGSTLLPLPDVWPSCVNSRSNFSRPDTGAYADQLPRIKLEL